MHTFILDLNWIIDKWINILDIDVTKTHHDDVTQPRVFCHINDFRFKISKSIFVPDYIYKLF